MKDERRAGYAGSQCKFFGQEINAEYIFCMNANMPLAKSACINPNARKDKKGCCGFDPVKV